MAQYRVPVVKTEDNRNAIIAVVVVFLITLFLLFFIKYHEPDPPKITTPIPITMADDGIEDFEVDDGGGGAPSEEVSPEEVVSDAAQEQPTQEEESPITESSGSGDSDDATSTSEEPSTSPFSGGGSGGEGDDGSGGGFGSDDGPGGGDGPPGTGPAADRVRLNELSGKPKTPNNQFVKIYLVLTVDSRGRVVRASVDRNNTTTTNNTLIDEVIEMVKDQIRYKEKPGARDEKVYFSVNVTPN